MKFLNHSLFCGVVFVAKDDDLLLFDNLYKIKSFRLLWKKFNIYIHKQYIDLLVIEKLLILDKEFKLSNKGANYSYSSRRILYENNISRVLYKEFKDIDPIYFTYEDISDLLEHKWELDRYKCKYRIKTIDLIKGFFTNEFNINKIK